MDRMPGTSSGLEKAILSRRMWRDREGLMQMAPPPKRSPKDGIDLYSFYDSVGAVAGAASAINFTGLLR
jgi:hypothetical protein